jgi:hypothetical protein
MSGSTGGLGLGAMTTRRLREPSLGTGEEGISLWAAAHGATRRWEVHAME